MRERVVVTRGIQDILKKLIADEMDNLERYVHAELCGVATVECSQSLSLIDQSSTVQGTSIWCSIALQSLLDYCNENVTLSNVSIYWCDAAA